MTIRGMWDAWSAIVTASDWARKGRRTNGMWIMSLSVWYTRWWNLSDLQSVWASGEGKWRMLSCDDRGVIVSWMMAGKDGTETQWLVFISERREGTFLLKTPEGSTFAVRLRRSAITPPKGRSAAGDSTPTCAASLCTFNDGGWSWVDHFAVLGDNNRWSNSHIYWTGEMHVRLHVQRRRESWRAASKQHRSINPP